MALDHNGTHFKIMNSFSIHRIAEYVKKTLILCNHQKESRPQHTFCLQFTRPSAYFTSEAIITARLMVYQKKRIGRKSAITEIHFDVSFNNGHQKCCHNEIRWRIQQQHHPKVSFKSTAHGLKMSDMFIQKRTHFRHTEEKNEKEKKLGRKRNFTHGTFLCDINFFIYFHFTYKFCCLSRPDRPTLSEITAISFRGR